MLVVCAGELWWRVVVVLVKGIQMCCRGGCCGVGRRWVFF